MPFSQQKHLKFCNFDFHFSFLLASFLVSSSFFTDLPSRIFLLSLLLLLFLRLLLSLLLFLLLGSSGHGSSFLVTSSSGLLFFRSPLLQVSSSSGLLIFRSPQLQVSSSGLLFRSPLQVSSSGLLFLGLFGVAQLRQVTAAATLTIKEAPAQPLPEPLPKPQDSPQHMLHRPGSIIK